MVETIIDLETKHKGSDLNPTLCVWNKLKIIVMKAYEK